jgi:murein L,D-transpeptidase YafK
MPQTLKRIAVAVMVLWTMSLLAACGGLTQSNAKATQPLSASATSRLASLGSAPGKGTMVRIYKESSELEVWKETTDGSYKLFKTYAICAWSGELGPKVKEGDRQSPEGFYTITPGLMNPNSNYYLAFDTGYPNKFDRAFGRTGSNLMVHGDCSSRGCYSMTDESIAEIYALVRESFKGGNRGVQLQIFPFRMTPVNLAKHQDSPHMAFWQNIKTGADHFELTKKPPVWDVCGRKYVFGATGPNGTALEAAAPCPTLVADAGLAERVSAKRVADQALFDAAVVDLANIKAREIAEAERAAAAAAEAAAAEAAAKARGEAMGQAITGFIGGIFGGGQPAPAATATPAPGKPATVAPIPLPAPNRT